MRHKPGQLINLFRWEAQGLGNVPNSSPGMICLEGAHRGHLVFAILVGDILSDVIPTAGVEVYVNVRQIVGSFKVDEPLETQVVAIASTSVMYKQ